MKKSIEVANGVFLKLINSSKGQYDQYYTLWPNNAEDSFDIFNFFNTHIKSNSDFSKTYFLKHSSVPRGKFREYGKSKNWSIVRNLDAATTIVIPNNYFNDCNITFYGIQLITTLEGAKALIDNSSSLWSFVKSHPDKTKTFREAFTNDNIIRDITSLLHDSDESSELVELNLNLGYRYWDIIRADLDYINKTFEDLFIVHSYHSTRIPVSVVELFMDYHHKCVFDNTVAQELGEVVIGPDDYLNVKTLIKSKGTDDRNLAALIMTQCNYSQSLLYLALFLFLYGNDVYNLPFYNSKDFRGLRDYFFTCGNVKNWNLSTLQTIIKNNKHLLDDKFKEILNSEMTDYVNRLNSSLVNYIIINDITFKYD